MNAPGLDSPLSPLARARLGESLRALLRQRIPALLRGLFDTLDDSLFELAEHAREPRRQRDFFDGMRECRKRRAEIEAATLGVVDRGLAAAFRDDLRTVGLESDPPDLGDAELRLVAEEDLEEDLALQAMVAKAESQLAQPLYALNQRIGFALEIPGLGDADNPVGPAALAEAFRLASRRLEIPMHVRLVVFKLFERHVLGGLDPIYSDLNIVLSEAGILPTLRPRLREVRTSPSPPPQSGSARGIEQSDASARAAAPEPVDDSAVLSRLIESIGSRRAVAALRLAGSSAEDANGANGASASSLRGFEGDGGPRIPTATLQEALVQLQRRIESALAPAAVKAQLLEQSHRLVGEEAAALRPADENVVDLVGMLFEQLQTDSRLPQPLQGLLNQLHVPVLRAALLDQQILADGQHPARRLIEEIAQAATGWSADADPGQRLLNRVRETVDWLRRSFDNDVSVFEQALRDLHTFNESQRRRAELAEQRATEAALGRERLLLARRRVAGALHARVQDRSVARWLGQLLARPWANYMVLAWLRQGEDSVAFREALAFVDALLGAGTAGAEADEALRLRLGELESTLRQGLATVAYHDSEVELLCAQLRSYVSAQLGAPCEISLDLETAPVPALFDATLDELEDQPDSESSADLAQSVAQLQAEGAGRWFELKGEDGSPQRAKLAWISPISTRCLLVNRQGLKVAEKHLEALAAEIERGVAQMLDGGLIVQRALEAIMDQFAAGAVQDVRAG